jgi:hypothetical protein
LTRAATQDFNFFKVNKILTMSNSFFTLLNPFLADDFGNNRERIEKFSKLKHVGCCIYSYVLGLFDSAI